MDGENELRMLCMHFLSLSQCRLASVSAVVDHCQSLHRTRKARSSRGDAFLTRDHGLGVVYCSLVHTFSCVWAAEIVSFLARQSWCSIKGGMRTWSIVCVCLYAINSSQRLRLEENLVVEHRRRHFNLGSFSAALKLKHMYEPPKRST